MDSTSLNSLRVNIDLAFRSISDITNLDIAPDSFENLVLQESIFWSNQLTIWIEYIRKDPAAICPDLVRKIDSFSIGLQFTDDFTITKLNKEWRQKPISTDVLSFPVFDSSLVQPGNNHAELGDIVVSIPTAQKQALEQKHKLSIELRWLVSHGLLHLLGWDHSDERTLEDMLKYQEQLLGISVNLSSEGIEAVQIL